VVPRSIHQIWIGPESPPREMLASWRRVHPDWEYRLWREPQIDDLGLLNRELFDSLYRQGIYAGAADVARAEILHRHGGVYVDADTHCLRSLDGAPFMQSTFWIVAEHRVPQPFLLSPAVLGSVRGARPLRDVIESLSRVDPALPDWSAAWVVTGPVRWTRVLRGRDDVIVVPPGAFYARTAHGEPVPADGPRYGDHRFGRIFARPNVTVLVSGADPDPGRGDPWRWLESYWMDVLHYAEFIVEAGPSDHGSGSTVPDGAITKASGVVIVVIKAGVLIGRAQVERGIEIARWGDSVIPYDTVRQLSGAETSAVLRREPCGFDPMAIAGVRGSGGCTVGERLPMAQIFPMAVREGVGALERHTGPVTENYVTNLGRSDARNSSKVPGPAFMMSRGAGGDALDQGS
jgi:hypothetical protein